MSFEPRVVKVGWFVLSSALTSLRVFTAGLLAWRGATLLSILVHPLHGTPGRAKSHVRNQQLLHITSKVTICHRLKHV